MKKKLWLILAMLALCAGMFVLTASAATEVASGECGANGDNLTWSLDSDGTLTISGEGKMRDWVIPWSAYASSVKTVVIEDGVTHIGSGVFTSCASLTSVTMADSVTSLGIEIFYACSSLTSVTLSENITNIAADTFSGCSALTSITIPDGVTTIGNTAFYGCSSLTEITIPDRVTSIGNYAFHGCTSLTKATILTENATFGTNVFGNTASGFTIGSYAGSTAQVYANSHYHAFRIITASSGCGANGSNLKWKLYDTGELVISGTGAMRDWSSGGAPWYSFRNSIKTVTIESDVTSIGEYAFYGCSALTSVTIGNSVISIGEQAFRSCSKLKSVTISDSVISIGDYAFYNCDALKSVTMGASVTSIGDYAFNYCDALTSVVIGDSVTSIGDGAFHSCTSLTSVVIGDSVTSIGNEAFCYCKVLTSVTIGNSVTSIGEKAFSYCSQLTSVTIPDSVISIGSSAFDDCSALTSVAIGSGVTNIGDSAFYDCSALTTVTLGDSVASIGESAFEGCRALTTVTIPGSGTSIGNYAFRYCSALTTVTLGDSVASIGNGAFYFCSALTSVTIPDSVTSIGNSAFSSCSKLVSIDVDANNANYSAQGGVLFNKDKTTLIQCPPKKSGAYTIPDSVTSIGDYAFFSCKALTSVTIPDSVISIGNSAFSACTALKSVTIGDSVTSIGEEAFASCSSLTSVTIPDSVTTIGSAAFYWCSKLTKITILTKNATFADKVFYNTPASFTIYGYVGSTAEAHANSNNYAFVAIREIIASGNCGADGDNLTWVLYDTGELVISGTGAMADWGVYIGNYEVTKAPWISYNDTIKTVLINEGVTHIGSCAFLACALTSLTIPDSVETLGCIIFDGTTDDFASPFSFCRSLTSVTLGSGVKSVNTTLFKGCSALESITVRDGNENYASVDGVLYNKDKTTLVIYPNGKAGAYTIPDTVTVFDSYIDDFDRYCGPFYECELLTSVTIPESVTTIPEWLFDGCKALSKATILSKDATIGRGAFSDAADGFTIHSYFVSTARTYALENNHLFTSLDVHVCDFTYDNRVDEVHPHAVYGICACGAETVTAESYHLNGCTICQPIQSMLASMTLGNELAINFFFYTSELGTATDYTAVVTKYNGDGTTTEFTVPYSEWTPNSTKYMKITVNGIAAKEMSDKLVVQVLDGNGKIVSKLFEDSIRAYIMRKLDGWSGDDAVWAVEALNYGTAAQLYFGYNTDDLANADLTDAQRALAPEMIDMPDISKNSTATLVLEENILLKLWFAKTAATNTTGMYAVVSYTDHTGEAVSYTLQQSGLEMRSTYVIVPIDTIVAADGNTAVTVTLYNADGTVYGTMVDSIVSYASRKASTNELFEAVARFCTASYNYFH